MPYITKLCETCGKPFEARLADHQRGHARFCSLSCFASRSREPKPANCVCAFCGAEFYRSPSKVARSKSNLIFCSRTCKDNAQCIGGIKDIQPSHYGDMLSTNSYRNAILRRRLHKCIRCGYDKSVYALVVHHIDGNRANNSLDNLELICANCHYIEHYSPN